MQSITGHLYSVTETLQDAGKTIATPPPPVQGKEAGIFLRDTTRWTATLFRGLGSLTTLLGLLPPPVVGLITFHSGTPIFITAASVTCFHVLAFNLLIPKLVGKEVQLNPVASTVSIMFFGWMWGEMGLILWIPIVAGLKSVLENMQPTRKPGQWLGD